MMRLMIQQISIMKIISSKCNTMFFSNYVFIYLAFFNYFLFIIFNL